MVCLLLSSSARPRVKKNWLPLSWGPAFAMATSPLRLKRNREWNSSWSIKKKKKKKDLVNALGYKALHISANKQGPTQLLLIFTYNQIQYLQFLQSTNLDFTHLCLLNILKHKFFVESCLLHWARVLKGNGFLRHFPILLIPQSHLSF